MRFPTLLLRPDLCFPAPLLDLCVQSSPGPWVTVLTLIVAEKIDLADSTELSGMVGWVLYDKCVLHRIPEKHLAES